MYNLDPGSVISGLVLVGVVCLIGMLLIQLISALSSSWRHDKKVKAGEKLPTSAYVRNSLPLRSAEDVLLISMTLSVNPVHSHGVSIPSGPFIAPSQYNQLTPELQKYFKKTTIEFPLR